MYAVVWILVFRFYGLDRSQQKTCFFAFIPNKIKLWIFLYTFLLSSIFSNVLRMYI